MSFILDALKKSENERQRTVGPSLADAPARRQQSERPWWVVAVGALLVVNLGVLMIVLIRDKTSDAPKPVAAPISQSVSPPPPVTKPPTARVDATAPHAVTNPGVRPLAEEAGVGDNSYYEGGAAGKSNGENPELAAAANVPAGPPIVRPIDPPGVAPLNAQSTFQSSGSETAVSDAELPTADALVANGTPLPNMRLDIHVYSNKPSERFVFINMHRYSEGQRLSEGLVLERITPEGAILNSQGTRFVLPRQ